MVLLFLSCNIFKSEGTWGEMYHKPVLNVILPAAQTISGEKNAASFLVIRGRFSCYSRASVRTSAGAGSGVWLDTFSEMHMANH